MWKSSTARSGFRRDDRVKPVRNLSCGIACCASLLPVFATAALAQSAPAPVAGLQPSVVFGETSPLSGNTQILRRMISPLAAAAARRALARSGQGLREQSIDPAKEIFTVYVPATKPPHGYGLLVFVPPWGEAKLPQDWSTVLDQYGVIYVSAANSANDANVLGRRDPLALIAYQNIVDRYPVDPEHVFIGGFSGGSRVAMRLALGYPDVFRGALLDAGADPIGDVKAPLPPRDLMLQFQSTSRLVYISGDEDTLNLQTDKGSMRSMRDWCVTDTDDEVAPHTSHDTPDGIALARVFAALYAPVPPDPSELASCRAGIDAEVTSKLQQVDALIASGNRDDARKLLLEIDTRFGGLAAPRSVELDAQLASEPATAR